MINKLRATGCLMNNVNKYLVLFLFSLPLFSMEEDFVSVRDLTETCLKEESIFHFLSYLESMEKKSLIKKYDIKEILSKFVERYKEGFIPIDLLEKYKDIKKYFISKRILPNKRRMIDAYLQNRADIFVSKQKILSKLENYFANNKITYDKNAFLGRQMMEHYQEIIPLLKKVYIYGDEDIVNLFKKYLPFPKPHLFSINNLPKIVKEKEDDNQRELEKFLAKNEDQDFALSSVKKIQRQIRKNNREIEQENNVRYILKALKFEDKQVDIELTKLNEPYFPLGCNKNLAFKIYKKALEIKDLWPTIKHITSLDNLDKILDDSLHGRRNLLNHYISFKPAALYQTDIDLGDGNAICMGPNRIDPKAINGNYVNIIFDFTYIKNKKYPQSFYKPRDLGFEPEYNKKRSVKIGKITESYGDFDKTLEFDHTSSLKNCPVGYTNFTVNLDTYSFIPQCLNIFSDVDRLDPILILNVFKFIDQLRDNSRESIYADIEKMSDGELETFLRDLGRKATDTAEFNFYGAYQIDIEAIKEIHTSEMHLKMDDLLKSLNEGNDHILRKVQEQMPQVLLSYRLVEYLISKTKHEAIKEQLIAMRKNLVYPSWYRF